MPDTCDKIFAKLGADEACRSWDNANVWGVLPNQAVISKGENLFPRIDVDEALAQLNAMQEAQKKAALPAVELEPYVEDEVDFDTFLKSDFRAVKIKNCEAVKKSDKLLKFTLDDGSGTDRTVQSYMRNMGLADQDLHIVARVDDPEAIKRMTAQGVGVSVLSALSVASEVDDGRLLTFPMDPQGLHRSIYLVYPRETILSQSEQTFVRFCRQMAIRRNL